MSIISTIWTFDHIEKQHTVYRGKDSMKKFCESLGEHAKNIIDFEKKKNVTVNKRRTKITSRCKILLHPWKKNRSLPLYRKI